MYPNGMYSSTTFDATLYDSMSWFSPAVEEGYLGTYRGNGRCLQNVTRKYYLSVMHKKRKKLSLGHVYSEHEYTELAQLASIILVSVFVGLAFSPCV